MDQNKLIFRLKELRAGNSIVINGVKLNLVVMTEKHHCKHCFFYTTKCTAPMGNKNRVCFANERLDNKPIIFLKSR